MYQDRKDIQSFIRDTSKIVLVEVSSVHGSAPRDEGTWMLVSKDQIFQTIGGGQLELLAIEKAHELIRQTNYEPSAMQLTLGPQTGQCCGGAVNLRLELLDEASLKRIIARHEEELSNLPCVYIFGAGHVGLALAQSLSLLPLKPIVVDTRQSELAIVPEGIEKKLTALPEEQVKLAPRSSLFIVLTHDHALDFLITQQALLREDASFVGMIGSKTKRAAFRNWLKREVGHDKAAERLTCPIGQYKTQDKRPEVIAAMVAAQIMFHLSKSSLHMQDYDSIPSLESITS